MKTKDSLYKKVVHRGFKTYRSLLNLCGGKNPNLFLIVKENVIILMSFWQQKQKILIAYTNSLTIMRDGETKYGMPSL